jgi:tetratricopeptide (TPR) repeat protein
MILVLIKMTYSEDLIDSPLIPAYKEFAKQFLTLGDEDNFCRKLLTRFLNRNLQRRTLKCVYKFMHCTVSLLGLFHNDISIICLIGLGDIYSKKRMYKEAVDEYSNALNVLSDDHLLYFKRGKAHIFH